MCSAQVSPTDSAAGLSVPPWRVVAVRVRAGFCLDVRFADGTEGVVDMAALLNGSDPGVFAPLRDAVRFGAVGIEHGALSWPGELDLAPDALYAAIKSHGRCAL